MTRPLKPCGTYAAYARHLRNGEDPCGPCLKANRERQANAPSGRNHYENEWDRELKRKPPRIVWRRKPNGIWVAASVRDPHAETKSESAHDRKMAADEARLAEAFAREEARNAILPETCDWGHAYDAWNTIINDDGSFECRTCVAHLDNSPLIQSARKI